MNLPVAESMGKFLAKSLLSSQERLCSVDLVSYLNLSAFQLYCGTYSSLCGVIAILSSMDGRDIPLGLIPVTKDVVHKEFISEGKTLSAEFYKEIMGRLLKHIQRIRPAAFCSPDFFLLHDNASAHKAASFCQFLTPKKLQPFIAPRNLQIYLLETIFSSPS
jgi:hypothetical protein